MTIFYSKD